MSESARLFAEKQTGFTFDDVIECATCAVGDDRCAGSHSFNGRDTKIFVGGKQKRFSSSEFVRNFIVG
jgi:hypothetical protein